MSKRQQGFGLIEGFLITVLIVALGVVGYVAWHRHNQTPQSATSPTTSVPAAPTVQKTSDLTSAEQTLDQTNVDAANSDSSQLDSLSNGF